MIIKGLFELVYNLLSVILTPFQIVPNMPASFVNDLNTYKTFLLEPINVLLFFVDARIFTVGIPLLIAILNMEHIWDGILWILKKLPFVGIE